MRPKYHFAPAANWLSDPNGLVCHAGEWHMFYQYNPQGEDWGHMSWGHAVSQDMACWQELDPALLEDDRHLIFSGSAVVDTTGAAGFGQGAMVAVYTGAERGAPQRQVQCLASSTDLGRKWIKYSGNPVLDRGLADFRDPNVFWHEPTCRWIMVVALSNEQCALIYASRDLKVWDEISVIHGAGAPGEVWECPLLIELPVEDNDQARWLFKVDVLRGAPGSGAIYQTGTFDGTSFQPDGSNFKPRWHVADWGRDFYAAIAWHEPRDEQGRPAWIGWMGNHAYQGRLPKLGWRGAMSLPRRLSLRKYGEDFVLRQEVEPAVLAAVPVADCCADSVPRAARLDLPDCGEYSLTIGDAAGRLLIIERRQDLLLVTRRDPVSPVLDTVERLSRSGIGALQLWLDSGSIEVFGAEGTVACGLQHRLEGECYSAQFRVAPDPLAA